MNQVNNESCQQPIFNNKINTIASSFNNLTNKNSVNQLNANDLYAILKPVIKPHIFDQQQNKQSISFNLLYLGSILIPYDTLSNASKLTSIRNLIEYFLIKNSPLSNNNNDSNCSTNPSETGLSFQEFTEEIKALKTNSVSSTNASIVNLKVSSDKVKLSNKKLSLVKLNEAFRKFNNEIDTNTLTRLVEDCEPNEIDNTVYYSKSEIAFCGKIKENKKFFALVILSNSQEKEPNTPDLANNSGENLNLALFDSNVSKSSSISSSCLVFRYLNIINSKKSSIDCLLNEISYIYRDQDCVFIYKNLLINNNNESQNYSVLPLVEPNIGNSNMTNNINYEILENESNKLNQDFHIIKNEEFVLLNKKTNDIYFKNMSNGNDDGNYVLSGEIEVCATNGNLNEAKSDLTETPFKDQRPKNLKNQISLKSNASGSSKKNMKKKLNVTPKSKLKSKLKTSKSSKPIKKINYNFSLKKTQNDKAVEVYSNNEKECNTEENEPHIVSENSSKNSFKNTEHSQTQSIRLIKENLANLFLSKKSHSSTSDASGTIDALNSAKLGKCVVTTTDDSDLLKTIEIETNKNILLNKQNETDGCVFFTLLVFSTLMLQALHL